MTEVLDFLEPGLRQLAPDKAVDAREALAAARALLVVDLEMSGPNPRQHEVLEAGCVRATLTAGFPEEASWGDKVRPLHIGTAVPGALKVVNYSPKGWKSAIDLQVAVEELARHGDGAVITGWGISGDLRFLMEVFSRHNVAWPFAPVAVDVQPIARKLLARGSDVDHFNLGHVADRLGLGRMGEHSALADAYATYDVLVALLDRSASGPEHAASVD